MQKETNRKKKVNSNENKANKSKATIKKKRQHKAPIESPKKL